jgi:hypothetical protein
MSAAGLLDGFVAVLQGTAIVLGGFLAIQAHRGYRRHGADRMRSLAVGVLFLTVVPGGLSLAARLLPASSDAVVLLLTAIAYLIGLAGVDHALGGLEE